MNNVPLAAKFQHLMMGLKFLFALSALLLLACSQAGSTPTSTPVPVPTPTPSPTPTPIPPPVASFVLQDAGGSAPLTVRFSDTSEGPASSWEWDFGDGASSTEQNPAHEYTEAIAFTVRLTVSGPGGSDTAILQDAIAVSPGLLEEVVVNQAGITLQVEDSARLNAEALDRYGNQISDVVLAWATQGPQGSVDETGQFHAGTVAGSYEALVVSNQQKWDCDNLSRAFSGRV